VTKIAQFSKQLLIE